MKYLTKINRELPTLLHVGHYNYIMTDKLVGIFHANSTGIRKNIRAIIQNDKRAAGITLEERYVSPRIQDLTGGGKRRSIIVLTGDKFIYSSETVKVLLTRLGWIDMFTASRSPKLRPVYELMLNEGIMVYPTVNAGKELSIDKTTINSSTDFGKHNDSIDDGETTIDAIGME